MSITLNTDSHSISESFTNKFYKVPGNQRPYAWKKKNVLALLKDIEDKFINQNQESHFIGAVLVYELDKVERGIIDGQQRLCTLFLILLAFYNDKNLNKDILNSRIKRVEGMLFSELFIPGKKSKYNPRFTSVADQSFNDSILKIFKGEEIDSENTSVKSMSSVSLIRNYEVINDFFGKTLKKYKQHVNKIHKDSVKEKVELAFKEVFRLDEKTRSLEEYFTNNLEQLLKDQKNIATEISRTFGELNIDITDSTFIDKLEPETLQILAEAKTDEVIEGLEKTSFSDFMKKAKNEIIEEIKGSKKLSRSQLVTNADDKKFAAFNDETDTSPLSKKNNLIEKIKSRCNRKVITEVKQLIELKVSSITTEILDQISVAWYTGFMSNYSDYLLDNVKYLEIVVDQNKRTDVFEVLNSRGLGLSQYDLFKNYVIKTKIEQKNVEDAESIEIEKDLASTFHSLEKTINEADIGDISKFLRYFLLSEFDFGNNSHSAQSIYNNSLKIEAFVTEIERNEQFFLQKIISTAEKLKLFFEGKHNNFSYKEIDSFLCLTGKGLTQYSGLLLGSLEMESQSFLKLIKAMEELAFYIVYTKGQGNQIEKELKPWSTHIRKARNDNSGVSELFYKEIYKLIKSQTGFLETFNNLQYKDRDKVRFVLARIEQKLRSEALTPKSPELATFMSSLWGQNYHLDHILALNLKPKEMDDEVIDSIGNLTLLENRLNILAKDKDFTTKLNEYYPNSDIKTTKGLIKWYAENNTSQKENIEWKEEEIERNKASYLEAIKSIYSLHKGSKND